MENAIHIDGLTVGFGDKTVIDALSLDVRRHETLGLIGASGGGKTVLLRALLGLIPKREGTIEILGQSRDRASAREIGRRWRLAELDREVRDSQRRRRIVDAALNQGEAHAWDFQPFRDASKQYVRNTIPLDDLEAMARFPRVSP